MSTLWLAQLWYDQQLYVSRKSEQHCPASSQKNYTWEVFAEVNKIALTSWDEAARLHATSGSWAYLSKHWLSSCLCLRNHLGIWQKKDRINTRWKIWIFMPHTPQSQSRTFVAHEVLLPLCFLQLAERITTASTTSNCAALITASIWKIYSLENSHHY